MTIWWQYDDNMVTLTTKIIDNSASDDNTITTWKWQTGLSSPVTVLVSLVSKYLVNIWFDNICLVLNNFQSQAIVNFSSYLILVGMRYIITYQVWWKGLVCVIRCFEVFTSGPWLWSLHSSLCFLSPLCSCHMLCLSLGERKVNSENLKHWLVCLQAPARRKKKKSFGQYWHK